MSCSVKHEISTGIGHTCLKQKLTEHTHKKNAKKEMDNFTKTWKEFQFRKYSEINILSFSNCLLKQNQHCKMRT